MIKLLLIFIFSIQLSFAHSSTSNKAKIIINKENVFLDLSIHSNDWTEKFKVNELDDLILKDTKLMINQKIVDLKAGKIRRNGNHYFIRYSLENSLNEKAKNSDLTLPKTLGKVSVTVFRVETKIVQKGKKVSFDFE